MSETAYLDVKGMHCVNCPSKVEKAISKMNGVSNISVDYKTEKGHVKFDKNLIGISDIIHEINEVGFEAKTSENHR
ncbi:heavy-metal-associated domain-containing protein [Virgibacillus sp. NKC19-16]|uniref:heavy-metal-associated domain-containing protein n=1 Tax=Virgibacillus salidurans TaxID=2831673 RepID=UPI001F238595|nr:heavy metal-associated domain-containing protein [Virgibacillus sp. NKC19-16]UJL46320.1 heavy-metal-associated domain-containing protein [Virgibacillus sp. NKC19-16]